MNNKSSNTTTNMSGKRTLIIETIKILIITIMIIIVTMITKVVIYKIL